jgi:PHD/YefM family antitoxin component YafN of YafNO toxin-antitoxin module
MATSTLLKDLKTYRLGKLPVVVLPLADYERMKEDLEMLRSRSFLRRIRKAREAARKERTVTLSEAKKRLGLRF